MAEAEDWIFISVSVSVFRILEMKVTESRRGNMRMLRMQSRPCFQKGLMERATKCAEGFVKQMNYHFIRMEIFVKYRM